MDAENCFICRKHAGEKPPPPGGYLLETPSFRICHAPLNVAPPGTCLLESQRHFLDYGEMTAAEQTDCIGLLARLYPILREVIGAERIYHVLLLEGIPHFHAWLVPRLPGQDVRGVALLQASFETTLDVVLPLCKKITWRLRQENKLQ